MIRSYSPDDKPELIKHIVDFQDYEQKLNPDWKPGIEIAEQYLDYLLDNVQQNNGKLLLATNPQIIGYVCFCTEIPDAVFCQYTPSYVRLSDLYIAPHARNQGIGKLLTQQVEAYAKDNGIQAVILNVLANNPARQMYARIGFQESQITMIKTLQPENSVV